jgi:hypothetical protein
MLYGCIRVNPADIWKTEIVNNWGGLADVLIFFSEAWSKASREKSAEAIVVRMQACAGRKRYLQEVLRSMKGRTLSKWSSQWKLPEWRDESRKYQHRMITARKRIGRHPKDESCSRRWYEIPGLLVLCSKGRMPIVCSSGKLQESPSGTITSDRS